MTTQFIDEAGLHLGALQEKIPSIADMEVLTPEVLLREENLPQLDMEGRKEAGKIMRKVNELTGLRLTQETNTFIELQVRRDMVFRSGAFYELALDSPEVSMAVDALIRHHKDRASTIREVVTNRGKVVLEEPEEEFRARLDKYEQSRQNAAKVNHEIDSETARLMQRFSLGHSVPIAERDAEFWSELSRLVGQARAKSWMLYTTACPNFGGNSEIMGRETPESIASAILDREIDRRGGRDIYDRLKPWVYKQLSSFFVSKLRDKISQAHLQEVIQISQRNKIRVCDPDGRWFEIDDPSERPTGDALQDSILKDIRLKRALVQFFPEPKETL